MILISLDGKFKTLWLWWSMFLANVHLHKSKLKDFLLKGYLPRDNSFKYTGKYQVRLAYHFNVIIVNDNSWDMTGKITMVLL